MTVENENAVRIEREFNVEVGKLFRACASPKFFGFCGADVERAPGKIDYRVGGRYDYRIGKDDFIRGEFLEIIQDKKIVFTWFSSVCSSLTREETGETRVTLTFHDLGKSSRVELVHEGFRKKAWAGDAEGGWKDVLGSVEKSLGCLPQLDRALELSVTRTIGAPRERVFQAWIDAEALKRWFFPSERWSVVGVEIDARVGGEYRLELRSSEGETFQVSGTYREIIPNRRLVFTWSASSEPRATETLVTVEFMDRDQDSTVWVTHELFPTQQARDEHEQGWGACLDNLGRQILR